MSIGALQATSIQTDGSLGWRIREHDDRTQYFHITVYIAMEALEYSTSCTSTTKVISVRWRSNAPTMELKYLLELFDQHQIGGTGSTVPCGTLWKELVYLLQLHEEKMMGDNALDSGLRALRSPIEKVDVEKPLKDLDEDFTKNESYDEPWCMPGFHEKADEPTYDEPNILK